MIFISNENSRLKQNDKNYGIYTTCHAKSRDTSVTIQT